MDLYYVMLRGRGVSDDVSVTISARLWQGITSCGCYGEERGERFPEGSLRSTDLSC